MGRLAALLVAALPCLLAPRVAVADPPQTVRACLEQFVPERTRNLSGCVVQADPNLASSWDTFEGRLDAVRPVVEELGAELREALPCDKPRRRLRVKRKQKTRDGSPEAAKRNVDFSLCGFLAGPRAFPIQTGLDLVHAGTAPVDLARLEVQGGNPTGTHCTEDLRLVIEGSTEETGTVWAYVRSVTLEGSSDRPRWTVQLTLLDADPPDDPAPAPWTCAAEADTAPDR